MRTIGVVAGLVLALAAPAWAQDPRVVVAAHARVLTGTWESAGVFTQRVAWDLRIGYVLIRKDGGRRCDGPGVTVDCDKVMTRGAPYQIFDVVGGAGAPENRPVWDNTGHVGTPGMAVEPVPYEGGGPVPTPAPPPAPAPGDVARVLERLDAIDQALRAIDDVLRGRYGVLLETASAEAVKAADRAEAIQRQIAALEARPVVVDWPEYAGAIALPGWLGGQKSIVLTPRAVTP